MPLYYKSGSSWVEFSSNPYPIGTLYYATKDVSPAPLVGGTWTKVIISSKEELVGYVAEATETDPADLYGYVSNYSFFHDGSKVTGTFTWNQGRTNTNRDIVLFSGLPTVSSPQTVESVNDTDISIREEGQLVLCGNRNFDWGRGYSISISYTSNQMLGGHPSFTNELLNLFFGGGLDG